MTPRRWAGSTVAGAIGKLGCVSRRPARYYPFVFDGNRYEVKAGLYPLGTDLGNGAADGVVFQRDDDLPIYREAKREAAERAAGEGDALAVLVDCGCPPEVRRGVRDFVCGQLDYEGGELEDVAMTLQEDLAIVGCDGDGTRLLWMHVALPSGWSPWTKRGRSFAEVHKPVPGASRIAGDALMRDIIECGHRRVRFVWGVQFDERLDQHPKRGRRSRFDAETGLWLRVERQVAVGLPELGAMLFAIHPYVVSIAEVAAEPARLRGLASAIGAMSDAELHYKGLRRDRDEVLAYLSRYAG